MPLFRRAIYFATAALFACCVLAQTPPATAGGDATSAPTTSPFVPYGATSQPTAGEHELIAKCISDLKSDDLLVCHRAHQSLRSFGPKAAAQINEAIADEAYPRQAAARLKDIIAWVDYPPAGVVWRLVDDMQQYDCFQDGDVVLAVDGKPVSNVQTFRSFVPEEQDNEFHEFTVCRKGTVLQFTAGINDQFSGGFRTWPDDVSIYQMYATKGKWDEKAEAAIRGLDGRDRQKSYQAASDAGCTDAWFTAKWIEHLRQNNQPDKSEELLARQKDSIDNTPGGLIKHGWGPVQAACTLIHRGKRKDAQSLIEQSLADARAANAWQGLPILAKYYISLMLSQSYEAGQKAWQEYGPISMASDDLWSPDMAATVTHMIAAREGPAKAKEFADKLPTSPSADALRAYYDEQCKLASQPHDPVPPNLVPVFSMPGNFFVRNTWVQAGSYAGLLEDPPFPGRLTFKIRMAIRGVDPTDSKCPMPIGRMQMAYGDNLCCDCPMSCWHSASDIDIWFSADGGIGVGDSGMNSSDGSLTFFKSHEIRQWHDVAVDVLPGRTRVFLDGKMIRDIYFNKRAPCFINAVQDGAGWEIAHCRYYVYTDAKIDGDAVVKLWDQFDKLISSEPDAVKARQIGDEIREMLTKIPAVRKYAEQIDVNLKMFERLMSKEGFEISNSDAFELFTKLSVSRGIFRYEDDAIVLRRGKDDTCVYLGNSMYLPDAFQVTGVVEIRNYGEETMAALHWWNKGRFDTWSSFVMYPYNRKVWIGPPYFMGGDYLVPNSKRFSLEDPTSFGVRVKGAKAALFLNFGSKPDLVQDFIWREGYGFSISGSDFGEKTEFRLSKLKFSCLPKDVALEEPMELPTPPAKATSQPTSSAATRSAGDGAATTQRKDW